MSGVARVAVRWIKFISLTVILAQTARLEAQDLRAVREPVVPSPCVTLKSVLAPAAASSGDIEVRARQTGSDQAGLDTQRIQRALDHCARGEAVELAPDAANSAFLAGPISLAPGVTLLVDKGVTLYGARNPESYAIAPGSCGVVNDDTRAGCKPLIAVKGAAGAAIMGEGVIDGQGGVDMIVDGRPSAKTWWDLAEAARTGGHAQAPDLVASDASDGLTLYRITLRNSPSAHVMFRHGDGLTAWGVRIDTPRTARNTVGIALAQSKNITVAQSFLRTGDDDIAITAGDSPSTNISVAHDHLYWGLGLSIGSETSGGVSGVRVEDLSLDGPDNGIRITSNPAHGGLVEDVVYQDVCIRNARSPIVFDTAFSFPGKGVDLLPVYDDIALRNVRLAGGGKIQFNGFDATHRIGVALDGVLTVDKPDLYRSQAIHTDLTLGPGPVNLVFTGDDSTVTGNEVKGNLPSCAAKFVPFP